MLFLYGHRSSETNDGVVEMDYPQFNILIVGTVLQWLLEYMKHAPLVQFNYSNGKRE